VGPIETKIKEKLTKSLDIQELKIVNESEKHAHHKGNPGGEETHFKIYLKCSDFKGISHLARHKKVYEILEEEIEKIHAISLELKE
jgi:BolA protein